MINYFAQLDKNYVYKCIINYFVDKKNKKIQLRFSKFTIFHYYLIKYALKCKKKLFLK